jgi:hypothetical protein
LKNQFAQQTRVAILGEGSEFIFMLTHAVIDFVGKNIDAVKYGNIIQHKKNDFVLIATNESEIAHTEIEPTIAVVTDFSSHHPAFLSSITPGGILIYNEENDALIQTMQNTENYFRKIPFHTPEYKRMDNLTILNTDLGELSLQITEDKLIYIEAARLLCLQIGVQEEEFYEALLLYCTEN